MTSKTKMFTKICTKNSGNQRGDVHMYRKKNYELKAPCAKSFSILRLFPFADVNLASGWRILAKSTGGHRQPSIDVRIVGFVFCKCKCKKILLAILKIRDSFASEDHRTFSRKKRKEFWRQFPFKEKKMFNLILLWQCVTISWQKSTLSWHFKKRYQMWIFKAIKWIEIGGTRYELKIV